MNKKPKVAIYYNNRLSSKAAFGITLGFGCLDSFMNTIMLSSSKHYEVFHSIIRFVSVYVMHVLSRLQRATQDFFDNQAMLANIFFPSPYLYVAAWSVVSTALPIGMGSSFNLATGTTTNRTEAGLTQSGSKFLLALSAKPRFQFLRLIQTVIGTVELLRSFVLKGVLTPFTKEAIKHTIG